MAGTRTARIRRSLRERATPWNSTALRVAATPWSDEPGRNWISTVAPVKEPRGRPGQAPPGQGLRLPALPAGAAPARHHATDHPAWHRVEPAAGPPSVCGGAVAGVAGRLPAPAGPLRAARRHPARVRAAGLRADLPQPPERGDARNRALTGRS